MAILRNFIRNAYILECQFCGDPQRSRLEHTNKTAVFAQAKYDGWHVWAGEMACGKCYRYMKDYWGSAYNYIHGIFKKK